MHYYRAIEEMIDENDCLHLFSAIRLDNVDSFRFHGFEQDYFLTIHGAILKYVDEHYSEVYTDYKAPNYKYASKPITLIDITVPLLNKWCNMQLPQEFYITRRDMDNIGIHDTIEFSFCKWGTEIKSFTLTPVYISRLNTLVNDYEIDYKLDVSATVDFTDYEPKEMIM